MRVKLAALGFHFSENLFFFLFLFLSLFLLRAAAANAADVSYRVVRTIAAGGEGGWDYVTIDASARRLYVSRGTRVLVLNADSGAPVGEIPNTEGVHGIALAPDLGRGFTSNGRANTDTIYDPEDARRARDRQGARGEPGRHPLRPALASRLHVQRPHGERHGHRGRDRRRRRHVRGRREARVRGLGPRGPRVRQHRGQERGRRFRLAHAEDPGALDTSGLRRTDGPRDRRESQAPFRRLLESGSRRPQYGRRPRRREGSDRQGHRRRALRPRRRPRLQLERRRHPYRHPRRLGGRFSRRPEPRDEGGRAHHGLRPEDARDLPAYGALRASPASHGGESRARAGRSWPAASRFSWPRLNSLFLLFDQSHASQEHVHRVKNLADLVDRLDRVPLIEGVRTTRVEAVIPGDDFVDFLLRRSMQSARFRLVIDERNHVRSDPDIGRRKVLVHGAEGHVALEILVRVVAMADAFEGADHFKADAVEQDAGAD